LPPIFAELQSGGAIAPDEMARTFNCGIGMAIIASEAEHDALASNLEGSGETVFQIGRIDAGQRGCTVRGSAGRWGAHQDWSFTHNA
jgi:phosphoribosylformylglycinamidine cyclo-ligase